MTGMVVAITGGLLVVVIAMLVSAALIWLGNREERRR